MAILLDMVSTIIVVVASPFSLAKLSCIFGIRSIFIIIQTWIEMLRAAIYFQLTIFWRIIIWAIAVLSLPVRALTALQREKMFEMRIHQIQMELENLVWDRKKLDDRLKSAINEYRLVEALLAELEDEHDKAICKMELLEGELHHLKVENQRLEKALGKSFWSSRVRGEGDRDDGQHVKDVGKFRTPLPKSSYSVDGSAGEQMRHKDNSEDENENGSQIQDVNKALSKAHGTVREYSHDTDSWHSGMNNVILQRREIALSRTFFSALLALLVGVIVWEAKDPCMPLVVALFAVAVISMKTVLMFLSTVRNKPAMDAVALLSFNWFMLGLLSYPMLPVVVHFLLSKEWPSASLVS